MTRGATAGDATEARTRSDLARRGLPLVALAVVLLAAITEPSAGRRPSCWPCASRAGYVVLWTVFALPGYLASPPPSPLVAVGPINVL